MQPTIHLLGISIKTFGVVFALAFVGAGGIVWRRLRELGRPVDWAYEMVFAALIGGLVGARVYFVIENYDAVRHDLLGNLFSGSGLVWYGGALGGAIAILAWAAWRGMLNLALTDLCAPALAFGYAAGRVGCQISGDGDYGKPAPAHFPTAMSYPHGTVPTQVAVYPTPIYETLAMGLVALALWHLRDRFRPGVLFALYLILSGAERLLVEFIRRNHRVLAGLTPPQLESIAAIVIGAIWVALVVRRRGSLRVRGAVAGSVAA